MGGIGVLAGCLVGIGGGGIGLGACDGGDGAGIEPGFADIEDAIVAGRRHLAGEGTGGMLVDGDAGEVGGTGVIELIW